MCNFCSKDSLRKHLGKTKDCKISKDAVQVDRSILMKELEPKQTKYKCDVCEKYFSSRQSKHTHMKLHSGRDGVATTSFSSTTLGDSSSSSQERGPLSIEERVLELEKQIEALKIQVKTEINVIIV
jgi:hypothetical protein